MAVYKCKMCGAQLEIQNGDTIAACEYCGTIQTVPTVNDDQTQSLFNRANSLRLKGEFDKAEQIYEKIIQLNDTQAEAYWGLILCKFGIEYVEDPATLKRVPTCHRILMESIIADEDYKSALLHADASQRAVYSAQAKEIDRLQKEALALSQKEEPYDVFICYKETDENGKRTQDSVIANDIYYQLTQEGLKVFYAAITLEDKLGAEYEPCIFAALQSAKVMLVIGTKPEYFQAVWVKNEWSRFLKIAKTDRNRLIIPCYRDMDAYELPAEFAHLQAQDMSKIGFINDVVRGIKKVIPTDAPAYTQSQPQTANTETVSTEALLERINLFLEDGEWRNADEYSEKVLDRDPKCAQAYIGKLLAKQRISTLKELAEIDSSFEEDPCFKKALRFADDHYRRELESVIDKEQHEAKIIALYSQADQYMNNENYSEELKVLLKALALDPNNALTLIKVGRCYRMLGMKDKAINSYQKAIDIDPKKGMAYTNMGTIYILDKKWKEAREQYEKGLPLISKAETDYWVAYANYAVVVAKLGDPARAAKMIKEAENHGYKNGDSVRAMAGIKKQGCYVATAVYGSYDCPQVWTLRRYRDETLAKTWYGRTFIKAYYAISPTLVERFGHTSWMRTICKEKLDCMVENLQRKGIESSPYEDRTW